MVKILIIEDEEPIRRVLNKILTDEDSSYKVDQAIDGKEGLEKINNNAYDLVLCDIKMPKLDGIEVLQNVKNLNVVYHDESSRILMTNSWAFPTILLHILKNI